MDSKQLNQLNPKLKEVYQRVMGTSPHKPSSGSPLQTPTQPPSPKPFQPQPITNNIQQNPKPQAQSTAGQPTVKKQTKITSIFIAIGSLIFIILYALIWIKLFKLEVSFLPF